MSAIASRFSLAPLAPEDIGEIMDVERQCFDVSPWTPGQFRHELKIPFSRTLVARDRERGGVAGYICRWAVGDEISILNLAVAPEFRRTGLGRWLVEVILAEARGLEADRVTLEVREKNDAARRLYESLAFSETGRRRNYYAQGDDALIMTRSIALDPAPREGLCPNPDTGV